MFDSFSLDFKIQLHKHLLDELTQKSEALKSDLEELQLSVNSETKSSAGDKHETGRAMAQLEVEQRLKSVTENELLLQHLKRIDPSAQSNCVALGSYVETDSACFFISVGLGIRKFNSNTVLCIGTHAPIYQEMKGLFSGDNFSFQGKVFNIKSII